MASQKQPSALEQELTWRLAELPVPIRIVHHQPEKGGGWYQWKALIAGTADCGTFADAVIQAIAYVQQQQGIQKLAAPEAHRKIERTTLEACLQRVRKVQATPLLYLHLGETGWLTGQEAAHSIRVNRFLDLEREAYLIEQNEGPGRPAGIYLQAANGWSYRAFDVEI